MVVSLRGASEYLSFSQLGAVFSETVAKLFQLEQTTRCFLIDDDVDDQEIFQIALQQVDQSISLSYANNGVEAIKKLSENDAFVPDFIFLDVNMPKMNGLQCLPEIKKLHHLRKSKVIMYSTSADELVIQSTRQMGAHDFLIKPDKLGLLVNKLAQIFDKA